MRSGVAIRYGNVAPEAKENFIPTVSESLYGTEEQMQLYNVEFPNYVNPCESYLALLDGTAELIPEDYDGYKIGIVSEQLSNADGSFDDDIVLTLESESQFTSPGFTFTFDSYNDIYATAVSIKWYRVLNGAETLLDEKSYTPTSAIYYCENEVEYFNKVIITFSAINMPNNRLRLRVIDYGYGTFFYGDELKDVKIVQEIDPISSEISINTADFTLDSRGDKEYRFQVKQPLNVYFDGELLATTFVKTSKRKSRYVWDIQSEDYIGLMDTIPFNGGMYADEPASNILDEIFTAAKVSYELADEFENVTLSGYIPITSCREALMQVAFALQAIVDTSGSDKVNIMSIGDTVSQTIPLNRIMQGQNFDYGTRVTAVELSAHTYTPVEDAIDVYFASESGTGNGIVVIFEEPLHDLYIVNGTIVTAHANYAIINANSNCILAGQRFSHTVTSRKKKTSELLLLSDLENVVKIDNATLVSTDRVDSILNKCYNWIVKTDVINARIIEGKHVIDNGRYKYGEFKYGERKYGEKKQPTVIYEQCIHPGDLINVETEYLGVVQGNVIKQSYNLNGNIKVKEVALK